MEDAGRRSSTSPPSLKRGRRLGGGGTRSAWFVAGLFVPTLVTTFLRLARFDRSLPWPGSVPDYHHLDIASSTATTTAATLISRTAEKSTDATATSDTSNTRGFEAPSMRKTCELLFPNVSYRDDPRHWSFAEVWDKIGPALRKTTYHHYPNNHPVDYAQYSLYRRWVDHLFKFYTAPRLRRSQAHPAPPASVRIILERIQKRIDDPLRYGPIRILVMGGSVTTGRDCEVNPLELNVSHNVWDTQRWCAYPNRLERLLNTVLFPRNTQPTQLIESATGFGPRAADDNYRVFQVWNAAQQATNSQVGAMTLEHGFLSVLERYPPHVFVSSYSANDAFDNEQDAFWVNQQDLVRAAHNLRPCDDHLPLVVLADDAFHPLSLLTEALVQTGSIYKTASWHNVMAVAYSNVARHVSDYYENVTRHRVHPLYGSGMLSHHHPGMGFHMGQAWTLFYNLAGAFHDACVDPYETDERDPAVSTPRHKTEKDATEGLDETIPADETFASTATAGTNHAALFHPLVDPLTKYRGRYRGSATRVASEWRNNEEMKAKRCAQGTMTSDDESAAEQRTDVSRPPYSTRSCAYAWMVGGVGWSVWSGRDIDAALRSVLTQNSGWASIDSRPKAGWYTNGSTVNQNSHEEEGRPSFTIELRNISKEVDHLTVLSLKSYGPEWDGSRIEIQVEVLSPANRTVSRRSARYFVDGFHSRTTSVSYPHRFRLPGEAGAAVGDTVRATFTKLGGRTFKMSGLSLCKLLMSEAEP